MPFVQTLKSILRCTLKDGIRPRGQKWNHRKPLEHCPPFFGLILVALGQCFGHS